MVCCFEHLVPAASVCPQRKQVFGVPKMRPDAVWSAGPMTGTAGRSSIADRIQGVMAVSNSVVIADQLYHTSTAAAANTNNPAASSSVWHAVRRRPR